jgi:hypothetical protein
MVSYTDTSFPWREAKSGEVQEAVNDALKEKVPYFGSIYIVRPNRRKDEDGKPIKQETEIRLRGWNSGKQILDETLMVRAYDIDVVERMGDSEGATIKLRDSADGELFEVSLRFDPAANTLQIEDLSSNVQRDR